MNTIYSIQPFLAVLVSLVAVVPIVASGRHANLREFWTFAAGAAKLFLVASMLPLILQGKMVEYTVAEVLPGLSIGFRVDGMGMLFALVASILWIATSAYSIGYMRGLKEHSQTRFFAFFAISLSATIGVAFAANLFTLYLFYEMLSLATFPLVTHHQDGEARGGGRKYLTYLLGASIGLALPAMLFTYHTTGTLEFSSLGVFQDSMSRTTLVILLLMFVFGFAKAGIMPLHSWLPGAMVAPTPVSSLLHAVAVVKVGVFSIFRVVTGIFGVELMQSYGLGQILCWLAAFTILAASLIALSQDGLKRRLAFSTIGQLSYIVLGAALLSPKALMGGMVHIGMHAFGKITLFFCAGAIYVATGKKNISEMVGIGRRMPVTMIAFFVGALSVIGLPPTGGFFSKWNLLLGSLQAGNGVMFVVLLVSSFLNAAYFLPVVYMAFFCTDEQAMFERRMQEAPLWCLVPLVLTALSSVALFFYPDLFRQLAELVVAR